MVQVNGAMILLDDRDITRILSWFEIAECEGKIMWSDKVTVNSLIRQAKEKLGMIHLKEM